MSPIDHLVSRARAVEASFDPAASLAGALAKREGRARRAKVARRVVVAGSGAVFLLLLLVRASAAPSAGASEGAQHEIAARALDDGGYARD